MTYKDAGERILFLREKNHYTREAFAEKVDISSKFLYEIETGKKGFSAYTLQKISDALSVSCDYILTGGEKYNKSVEKMECVLQLFEPDQMGNLQKILQLIHDMSTDK